MSLFVDAFHSLRFYINGELKVLDGNTVDPRKSVLEYLRENGHTGTKNGCNDGYCGACTVVVAEFDHLKKMVRYRSANACLLPLCMVHNKQVITIEGIGSYESPHCIQERLSKGNGTQCGFCTPGMVMAFFAFLKINPDPSLKDIEESIDGNLCRCTGYRSITESFKTFSKEKNCSANKLVDFDELMPYDPTSDLPFPQELATAKQQSLVISNGDLMWLEPLSVDELLKCRQLYPNSVLVGGGTKLGQDKMSKQVEYNVYVNIAKLVDLQMIEIRTVDGRMALEIGASVILCNLFADLKNIKEACRCASYHHSLIDAFLATLKSFGSNQIRNFATVGGNIMIGAANSGLIPVLMASDSTLVFSSNDGQREIKMRDFSKDQLKSSEVLLKVRVPLPESNLEVYAAYKQSKRKENDSAIVNAAFRLKLENDKSFSISELDLVFGGLSDKVIHLNKVKEKSKGLQWGNKDHLEVIYTAMLSDVDLPSPADNGMLTYRRTLALSFFTKFWQHVIKQFNICSSTVNVAEIQSELMRTNYDFGEINNNDPYIGTTQKSVSSMNNTTATTKFIDDIPKQANELHAAPVLSSQPHAYIKSVDASKALSVPGVHAFIDHKDIKNNSFGIIIRDEEIFASKEVHFVGQLIGLVVAETKSLAKKAAAMVHVDYEPLKAIFTIQDAIENNSFHVYNRGITNGEFNDETFKVSENDDDVVIEGTVKLGGQEQFYLETNGCLVIPKIDDNEVEVYSSTQSVTFVQREVALALSIPFNRVVSKVKRIGGSFGGKETRSLPIAAATAAAANKLKRPVRYILDRDVDILSTGTRHPFYASYKLRITKDGFFKAYEVNVVSNAGFSIDSSEFVMDLHAGAIDGVYKFPKLKFTGKLAKTNIPTATAMRGFGTPQGHMITEAMITEVADILKLDASEIRAKNMYKPNDYTHFNKLIEDWYVPEMWNELHESARTLRDEVEIYNSKSEYKKRGLAVIPTRLGISYIPNQAGALVHIYTDGSVLISHGGVEMGQGLNTKMIQIAANTLQVPIDCIHISETSSDKVPNTWPSVASVNSDIYGMAVYEACKQLFERLEPYRSKNPEAGLGAWAFAAFFDRVSLSATGFYKAPALTYNWETNTGNKNEYFVTGVALSVVELDTLTGDHVILRTDIIMDIGNSLNYAIDIGQIEGAFLQGVGWLTTEELLLTNGRYSTTGGSTYKIPTFGSVPVEFNVKILKDKEYKSLKTIKTSKGIGEPPLLLASSVFFALRDAVCYARKSNGVHEPLIGFESPCTCEILRLACADDLVKKSEVNQTHKWPVRP